MLHDHADNIFIPSITTPSITIPSITIGRHNRHDYHCQHYNTGYCRACHVRYCRSCEEEWPDYSPRVEPYIWPLERHFEYTVTCQGHS